MQKEKIKRLIQGIESESDENNYRVEDSSQGEVLGIPMNSESAIDLNKPVSNSADHNNIMNFEGISFSSLNTRQQAEENEKQLVKYEADIR